MNEAFVDFTGGVGEVLYLRQNTPGLFAALRHALAKESLVGATALVRAEPPYGPPLGWHGQGCGGGGRSVTSFLPSAAAPQILADGL